MSASNYSENLMLNAVLTAGALTRPSAWWVGLHTADPGETGATAEVTGGAYQRTSATFGTATTGSTSNTGAINFPSATAAWGTVTHVTIWDAQSGGNCLWSGPHNPASQVIPSGATYSMAAGQLTVSLD